MGFPASICGPPSTHSGLPSSFKPSPLHLLRSNTLIIILSLPRLKLLPLNFGFGTLSHATLNKLQPGVPPHPQALPNPPFTSLGFPVPTDKRLSGHLCFLSLRLCLLIYYSLLDPFRLAYGLIHAPIHSLNRCLLCPSTFLSRY